MEPLATPAQLATRLGTATQAEADAGSPDILDTSRALDALSGASGSIRGACRWPISRIVNDTATVYDWADYTIFLPTRYLSAATVTVGVVTLVEGIDFTIRPEGIIRLAPNGPLWLRFSTWSSQPINVTFTHGYSPVPDDVADLCLSLAVDRYENPGRKLSTGRGDVNDVFPRFATPDGEAAYIRSKLSGYVRPVAA